MSGFKSKLKSVLADAVSNFQDSGDPNDACIKAANAAGFNRDQADRLVETFNTARVICNYKSADDKAGSCSLADKETVHAGLVTRREEKAAEAPDADDMAGYLRRECDHYVHARKAAADALPVPKDDPISREASDWLALRRISSLRQLAKTAAEEARAAEDLAREHVLKLASAISRNASLDAVHDTVARLATAYACDERYAAAVEKLAEALPQASDPDAATFARYARMHVVGTEGVDAYAPALKEAADLMANAAALTAFADETALEAKMAEARLLGACKSAADADAFTSASNSMHDALIEAYSDEFKSRKSKAVEDVSNLRRKLILQDLLLRDRILSKEDPDDVLAAYRSLHQISPDATLNRDVMRSMLRQAVQSVAISPYDAKTLADIDKARHSAYERQDR